MARLSGVRFLKLHSINAFALRFDLSYLLNRTLERRLIIACILVLRASLLFAQGGYSNLEFVENKGQWDNRIHFKAEISNGTFFLQKTGFTVLMYNQEDMYRLRETSHGHLNSGSSGQPSLKALATKTAAAATVSPNGRLTVRSHAYQVGFVNASDNVEIVPDKPLPTYNNYFIGQDPSQWASHCQVYQGVTYKNIYPNIDVRYYTDGGGLKYDLIIHPGANPDRIAMKYLGADKMSIKNNQLITHTSVSDVKGLEPHTYQLNESGRSELRCRYVLTADNTVKFKIDNYSPDATIVIDPTLVFSTFTGSRADNWGYTATYDAGGNFYSGSIVLDDLGSGNGFPVSAGAFQSSFQGGDGSEGGNLNYDIGIMKFNSTGSTRVYATYLGGSGDEQPHSLIVDNSGNLVVAGRTSSSNFPTKNNYPNGLYGPCGGFDIFIAKLDPAGANLIGSVKIGGKGSDGVNIAPKYSTAPIPMGQSSLRLNYGDDGRSEVIIDGSGNICLASCTQSQTGDFPLSANAFQRTFGGGLQDGVFIKTDPTIHTVQACSYLGGSGDDAAFVLDINPSNGNIYVGGGTSSLNFPLGSLGGPVLFNSLQGEIDGFVSIISPDGGTLIKTTYIGTTGTEVIYGIKFDSKGFPYIMGTTTGTWPITPSSVWKQPNGKQFIAKLMPDLSGWVYSTTFGKGDVFPDISPTAFLVDRCENVYVAGWGGGLETEGRAVYNNSTTSGLSVTPDAIKKTTDNADFYFFVLAKNATGQLYGSFFGQNGGLGDHVDGGTSRFDKQGIIYEAICANCYDQAAFPTTPGTWSPQNGTGQNGCNLAAVKIAFNFAGVSADVKPYINGILDSSGCIPLTVLLSDTIRNAKSYIWNFGDGTPDTSSTTYQVTHTFTNIGSYQVMIIAIDSSSCNISDTVYVHIRANNNPANLNFSVVKLAPCQSLAYQFFNSSTAPPAGPPFGPASFVWDFGDGSARVTGGLNSVTHSYVSPGTYTVRLVLVDTNYCNFPDSTSMTLRVAPLVKAQFTTPSTGCAPYTAVFQNTSLAGQQFFWDFGDGTTSTDPGLTITHLYNNVGIYTVKLTAVDSNTCNIIDSTSANITVNPKPQAAFTYSPNPPVIANKPTIFNNNSTGGTQYVWIFGDGDTAIKTNLDTVEHQYQKTGTFQACLVAINQFGCADTTCLPVQTLINPLLDVPNAFTPGRFGQNSIIKVQGFGISSMIFRIYNRWGQLVFESNNPNQGWDGTYRGNPQPMDVYAYTLDANFFDGTKTSKKGDITLIR
jgi:gliding motility-associated-like protein